MGQLKRDNLKLINFYSKKLNYWRGFFEKYEINLLGCVLKK